LPLEPLKDIETEGLTKSAHDVPERHEFGASFLYPATPQPVGTTASSGGGLTPSRDDHIHNLGANTVTPTQLANGAINSQAKFASPLRAYSIGTSNPSSPIEGEMVYRTDLDQLLVYTTSTTGWRAPWNLPWGMVGLDVNTTPTASGVSSSYADTGVSITFTAVDNRWYRISYKAGRVLKNTTDGIAVVSFTYAGGTLIDQVAVQRLTASTDYGITGITYTAFTGGSQTVKVRAYTTDANSATFQNGSVASILIIEDMGPTAAPL
jgi:hypothetical protein